MKKRALCPECKKAMSACICKYITSIDNQHFIHILQHPSEEKKAIGTARILDLSLQSSKITTAEVFNESEFDINNCYLVFPDELAIPAEQFVDNKKQIINAQKQFILLDGSWKKAYKLLMLNPFLQKLPKISININQKSAYRIRKSPREDGLSTVEAGYYLLSQLENNNEKFKPLLSAFSNMIDDQIAKMPPDIYKSHYLDKE